MKTLRMMGPPVFILLFFTAGLCFGQNTDERNSVGCVKRTVKWKSVLSNGDVANETTSDCDGLRPFPNFVNQGDAHDPMADLDEPEDDVEKKLDDLKKQFEEFAEELNRIPESEEVKRFLKKLERLREDLKRGGESAKEKIEKEIIPRLKEEMEKLKKKFLKPRKREAEEPIEV